MNLFEYMDRNPWLTAFFIGLISVLTALVIVHLGELASAVYHDCHHDDED